MTDTKKETMTPKLRVVKEVALNGRAFVLKEEKVGGCGPFCSWRRRPLEWDNEFESELERHHVIWKMACTPIGDYFQLPIDRDGKVYMVEHSAITASCDVYPHVTKTTKVITHMVGEPAAEHEFTVECNLDEVREHAVIDYLVSQGKSREEAYKIWRGNIVTYSELIRKFGLLSDEEKAEWEREENEENDK